MKRLYVVMSELCGLIFRNVFMFCLFVVCVIISGFMASYFYTTARAADSLRGATFAYVLDPGEIAQDMTLSDLTDVVFYRFDGGRIRFLDEDDLLSGAIPDEIRVRLSGDDDGAVLERLQNTFTGRRILVIANDTEMSDDEARIFIQVALLFLLSFASIAYQIGYFLRRLSIPLGIYMIIGASRARVIGLAATLFGMIIVPGAFVSLGLYRLLFENFGFLNMYEIRYPARDALAAVIFQTAAVFVLILIVLMRRISIMPIAARNLSEASL